MLENEMTDEEFFILSSTHPSSSSSKQQNMEWSYFVLGKPLSRSFTSCFSVQTQLREDMKKGVYVDNLTKHNVDTVDDVLKLLVQGTANRKVAATHINGESNRSHSVFTCNIESRWEKDSMTHIRFARLNLVDLAGSERQKSFGADSERLKEAANINKSLSTLGWLTAICFIFLGFTMELQFILVWCSCHPIYIFCHGFDTTSYLEALVLLLG